MTERINESILNAEIKEHLKENRTDHMTYLEDMEVLDAEIDKLVIKAAEAFECECYTSVDVKNALSRDRKGPEDFAALLSPAALPLLEEIAQAAQAETRKHFGNSITMFTPLYIANYCEYYCIYCIYN